MSEGTEIQVASKEAIVPLPPQEPDDIVVVANTAEEMEVAQKSLLTWVQARVLSCEAAVKEANENLEHAKKNKWKSGSFAKIAKQAEIRLNYYTKMKLALEAGYTIMPDLPGIVMCVKTSATKPRSVTNESDWNSPRLPLVQTDASPAGVGRYVDPEVEAIRWTEDRSTGKLDGQNRPQTKVVHLASAESFNEELNFPIKLVKPAILDSTSKAMLTKIFDEIVVMPGGKVERRARITKNPDPIVLGRIVRYEGNLRIVCSFLITWWIDTRTL